MQVQHRGHSFEIMIPCHSVWDSVLPLGRNPHALRGMAPSISGGEHVNQCEVHLTVDKGIWALLGWVYHYTAPRQPPHPHPILCRYIPRTATRGQPLRKMTETGRAARGRHQRLAQEGNSGLLGVGYSWKRPKPNPSSQPLGSVLWKSVYPWVPVQD